MTALLAMHARLVLTITAFFVVMALWGGALALLRLDLSRWYRAALWIGQLLVVAEAALGVALLLGGRAPGNAPLHILCGIVAVVTLPGVALYVRGRSGRGVAASYGVDFGRTSLSLGGGYDRRKFIGAQGTILEAADGTIDQNVWVAAHLGRQLDRRSNLGLNAYGNWFESGADDGGSATGYGASVVYSRDILAGLSASAAVSLDGISRNSDDDDEDLLGASAMAAVRYSF